MSTTRVRPHPTHIQTHTAWAHKTRNTPWYDINHHPTTAAAWYGMYLACVNKVGNTHDHESQGYLHTNCAHACTCDKTCLSRLVWQEMPNQQHSHAHKQGTISSIQPLPPPCEPVCGML
jgi:hypothetical protein